MSYRPNIRLAIDELLAGVKGKTSLGMSVSIQHGKGKFMVTLVDRGGIKEGWLMSWYPYTRKSVDLLRDIIKGKKI